MTDAMERKEAVIFMFYENKLLDLSAEIQISMRLEAICNAHLQK
jgi:putative component of toxin-antitoxin plasmid stabilization module